MDIEIRDIDETEFDEFFRLTSLAFGEHPDPKETENERLIFEPERSLAAFEGTTMVGSTMSATMRMTVPGGDVPLAGVTSVGVAPTHRRRGVLTAMMRRQIDDIRERGEPVAALYTSEAPIYGRFGYGVASFATRTRIERPYAVVSAETEPRRVRLLPREEALAAMPAIYGGVVPTRAGLLQRNEAWWEYRVREVEQDHHEPKAGKPFFVVSEGPDGPDGYAIYRTKVDWSTGMPNGMLDIAELIGVDVHAEAALWRYCFGVDLMSRFDAWLRPVDEPLVHMLEDTRRLRRELFDALWVRLIDVPAALEARRYATEGSVVFEIHDGFCGWNEQRVELDGGPDGATCRPSDRSADLIMSAADLGSAYLGGVRLGTLARAGRVDEVTHRALVRADAMFAWDQPPWCANYF
ncbi:MAG TPA: GNAT family N-acetyltransferase [Actinomycetota bacterium]|nr:GNAT family N-acetyltransferase [Actinomycetota bacterium]